MVVPPPPSSAPADDQAAAQSDRARLEQLLAQPGPDAAVANAVARFLPTTLSRSERPAIHGLLAKAYLAALKAGADLDPTVETALCGEAARVLVGSSPLLHAAYRFATDELRLEVAARCLAVVRAVPPSADETVPVEPVQLAKVEGTLTFLRGDAALALAPLKLAATNVDVRDDPLLHLRLVRALVASAAGQPTVLADACVRAQALYREHPLLPGIGVGLGACATPAQTMAAVKAALDVERRERLLASRRDGGAVVKPLPVEDAAQRPVDLELRDPERLTVVAFFSTWCPHCAKELPRLNGFVAHVAADAALKDRVRLLGVRTSVERELEPWDGFVARVSPSFPIWTDPTLSLAFASFCKAQGLKPALPTVVLVDRDGRVRYVLTAGDYQDTATELAWAVHSLLDQPASDEP